MVLVRLSLPHQYVNAGAYFRGSGRRGKARCCSDGKFLALPGNTVFPLLNLNPDLYVFACDFSSRAVDLVKAHPLYVEGGRVSAFVADITQGESGPREASSWLLRSLSPFWQPYPLIMEASKKESGGTSLPCSPSPSVGSFIVHHLA